MTMTTIANLKTIFKGVSSFRYAKTIQASVASAAWDFELPIANDSFNLTQDGGTLNSVKVFGLSSAWTITGQPGDISLSFFLPTIHDDLMQVFYTQKTGDLTAADETVKSVSGNYKGKGYFLTTEMLEGSAMIISEDRKYALFIRNIQGYPSMVFDSPLDKPMGVNLNLQVVGGDAEADIALLTWTPKS